MEITQTHYQQLQDYFSQRPEVIGVYLYGSYARGEQGSLSDIDIGVLVDESKFESGKSATQYRLEYIGSVMDIFMTDDVDVQVVDNDSPLAFAYNVISEGKLILSNNESARIDREVKILNYYLDFLPFENLYDEYMYKRLKEGTYGTSSV